tara:strand:+ start:194 stop:361 length:168 start_codon:yes stop_codon:yes gene_type:complete
MNLDENPLDVDDEMIEDEEDSSVAQKMTNRMSPKIDLMEATSNLKPHSIIENAKS